jgi:hypothetical protein
MIDLGQLQEYVVRPTLAPMNMDGLAAERLVLGTALTESRLTYIDQVDRAAKPGPAFGLWQIELPTAESIYNDFLQYHPTVGAQVMLRRSGLTLAENLTGNLHFGALMCRLIYWRRPEPLPAADDLEGLALYWKAHYNTHLGAGRPGDFMAKAAPVMEIF